MGVASAVSQNAKAQTAGQKQKTGKQLGCGFPGEPMLTMLAIAFHSPDQAKEIVRRYNNWRPSR